MTLLEDRIAIAEPPRPTPSPTRRRWERPALAALLIATAVLYLWGLGSLGWANNYYAAAVQAGSQDWKAWLFGSLDSGNAITVDKPPASLWVMGLSARLFGFSAFAMLLPQALIGVGTVALLYAAVRRCSGPAAGLIAGAVMALTPVAAVMFRYNNPDALLVLLLVAAAYFVLRAIDAGSTRWIALAGAALGFAFLTKMLQAALVLPALAAVFVLAAPGPMWKRLWQMLIGAATMVVSGGWLLLLVSLWPADSRPYIGGSTDNSLLQLALGYNGVQRVAGDAGPGGGNNPMFGGPSGIGRLFAQSMGTEISWLLPAALIGLVAGIWFTARTARTGHVRAQLLLWGGWLLVSGAVFSFMTGVIHPYYTVALAPAIAALIGISVRELWQGREFLSSRVVLATMCAATGVWAFILLDRTPDWLPALRWALVVGSIGTAAVLAVGAHRLGRATVVVAAAALLLGLVAPAAYSVDTVARSHHGPVPAAGPTSTAVGPGPDRVASDNAELHDLLTNTDTRWAAATVGAMTASGIQLQSGAPIMAIGGFTGSDNSPTLQQFQQDVAAHQVRYFIAGKAEGPRGRAGTASAITNWVTQHFTSTNVGGTTVYDLTSPSG